MVLIAPWFDKNNYFWVGWKNIVWQVGGKQILKIGWKKKIEIFLRVNKNILRPGWQYRGKSVLGLSSKKLGVGGKNCFGLGV